MQSNRIILDQEYCYCYRSFSSPGFDLVNRLNEGYVRYFNSFVNFKRMIINLKISMQRVKEILLERVKNVIVEKR